MQGPLSLGVHADFSQRCIDGGQRGRVVFDCQLSLLEVKREIVDTGEPAQAGAYLRFLAAAIHIIDLVLGLCSAHLHFLP